MEATSSPPDGADTVALCAILGSDGAVVVDNVLEADFVQRLVEELKPHIERSPEGRDGFAGKQTTRTGGLLARSRSVREVVLHPLATSLAKTFLGPWTGEIQLQLTQVIRLLSGQGAQPLHRDRLIWGPYMGDHLNGVEPQFNCMWALSDFTEENGATVVVPQSQAWPTEREAMDHELRQATMARGSVMFYTGSVLHGGGRNRSRGDRIGLNINYCLAWLRQEENQYLSCPPAIARELEPDLQDLLGYTTGGFGLGYFSDPESSRSQTSGSCARPKSARAPVL